MKVAFLRLRNRTLNRFKCPHNDEGFVKMTVKKTIMRVPKIHSRRYIMINKKPASPTRINELGQ